MTNCIVCGLGMSMRKGIVLISKKIETGEKFTCDNFCCQLPPYTRHTFECIGDKLISKSIIVDIGEGMSYVHYSLLTQHHDNPKTYIGYIEPIFDIDEDNMYKTHIYKQLCEFDYIIPWHDCKSAIEVINRVIKIKAFA